MRSSDDDFKIFQNTEHNIFQNTEREYEKSVLGEKPKREFGKKFKQKHYEHKILKTGGSKRNSLKDRDLSGNKGDSALGKFLRWHRGLNPREHWVFTRLVYGIGGFLAAIIILGRLDDLLPILIFIAGVLYVVCVFGSYSNYSAYVKLHGDMGGSIEPFGGFRNLIMFYTPIAFNGDLVRLVDQPAGVCEFRLGECYLIKENTMGTIYKFYLKNKEALTLQISLERYNEIEKVVKNILQADSSIEFKKSEIGFNDISFNDVQERMKKLMAPRNGNFKPQDNAEADSDTAEK